MKWRVLMLSFGLALAGAEDDRCLGCHATVQAAASKEPGHPAMIGGCGTCHVDHKPTSAASASEHYLMKPPGELCITCHAEIVKKEFVHEPAKKDCTICHDPHRGLTQGLRAQANALCLECHFDGGKAKFETDGAVKLFGGQVTLPHRYFQTVKLLALSNDRGHPVSNHPVFREQDSAWPAVSCMSCHNPHATDRSAALLTSEVENFALCQGCHK